MKVIIFGASGMVGQGVLQECVKSPEVESVLTIVRTPTGGSHEKVQELIHKDFFDFTTLEQLFKDFDACFFCLGVSSAGMTEKECHRLTFDIAMAAARVLAASNPAMTFVYVSGSGTDSSEKGARCGRA